MLHKSKTMWVLDSREVKGSRQGSFARTFASLTFAPSRVLFGWSAIYGSVEEELFSLSPFLPRGSLEWCLVQTTAGYCQFCVGLWNTALQCLFQRLFENTLVQLASTSDCLDLCVNSLWKKKKGQREGKGKRLSVTTGIPFKRQTAVFRGTKFK